MKIEGMIKRPDCDGRRKIRGNGHRDVDKLVLKEKPLCEAIYVLRAW